jgi:hypothetical protein
MKKIILNITVLILMLTFTSCDKEYNTIGSDIIGGDNYDFNKYDATVIAYSKATGAVQTNNLPVNALGTYENTTFGRTSANFVTQVSLATTSPVIGTTTTNYIKSNDSVYLYIPYFFKLKTIGTGNERNTYEIDSIYGDMSSSIDLKIYENRHFIRSFENANPQNYQKYYSDDQGDFESNLGAQLNTSVNTAENTQFKFSDQEYIIYNTDGNGNWLDANGATTTDSNVAVIKERMAPGIWINLDKTFFESQILNASSSNLVSNNVFREYFKGLYFKVAENAGQNGALAMLDFSKGSITIQYHSTINAIEAKRSLKLNLTGNTANFIYSPKNTEYESVVTAPNTTEGNERLYLKGNDGSVTFIELFGADDPTDADDIPEELEVLRANKWLINDAFITFYIDKTKMGLNAEPERIYLYDATNNIPLIDYTQDISTLSDTKRNKYLHGGIIERSSDLRGVRYRIRISNHINRILNSDDATLNKNVKLGLVVTENINNVASGHTKNEATAGFKLLPQASIMNPLGTVLYGTHSNVPMDKKLKLEIYYTKPN